MSDPPGSGGGGDDDIRAETTSLQGRWYRSSEEETSDMTVFRPSTFPFPAQRRPRESFELGPDGTALLYGAGPADASVASRGSWSAEGDTLVLRVGTETRSFQVVAPDAEHPALRLSTKEADHHGTTEEDDG